MSSISAKMHKPFLTIFSLLIFFNCHSKEEILLKDYNPKSIFANPKTSIQKAKFPIIDVHSHPDATSTSEIEKWIAIFNQSYSENFDADTIDFILSNAK